MVGLLITNTKFLSRFKKNLTADLKKKNRKKNKYISLDSFQYVIYKSYPKPIFLLISLNLNQSYSEGLVPLPDESRQPHDHVDSRKHTELSHLA